MPNHRVTVLLSDEEYTQVRSMAGLVPLSAWFRGLALNVGQVRTENRPVTERNEGKQIREAAVDRKSRPADEKGSIAPSRLGGNPPPETKPRKCYHGVTEGFECYVCGGLAKVKE
jgi:hypothetical protein